VSEPLTLRWLGSVTGLDSDDRTGLFDRAASADSDAAQRAAEIIQQVRSEGDAALLALAERFDGVRLEALEVPRSEWTAAWQAQPEPVRRALARARDNIHAFHAAQIPETVRVETEPGVSLERRVAPVDRAGVYAPGGRAAYPSSVLMGVVPAKAVGVADVVVCSPPGPDGRVSATIAAAAHIAGADRLFLVGGAQAIAAMALGTETVPRVDVLVGPGNRYVNEAKRQLAGTVRIDSPAGPSELLVVADASAPLGAVAAELVAQAEHDPDACAGVVVYGPVDGPALVRALADAVAGAERAGIIRESLANSGFVLTAQDEHEAVAFAQAYAAEHTSVMTADSPKVADRLTRSGTVFVGPSSSVSFGDYITGANHVLPTGGLAGSFSGLDAQHFLRAYTVQTLTAQAAADLAEATGCLADAEGLPGHAAAARRNRSSIPSDRNDP